MPPPAPTIDDLLADALERLQAGAHIYVCGDGKRMAPAVRETLAKIADIDHLEATGRYVADVFSG